MWPSRRGHPTLTTATFASAIKSRLSAGPQLHPIMSSASSVSRPTVKVRTHDMTSPSQHCLTLCASQRASHTWPGNGMPESRSHFEDFLREIGASTDCASVCCVPRPSEYLWPTYHSHRKAHHPHSHRTKTLGDTPMLTRMRASDRPL